MYLSAQIVFVFLFFFVFFFCWVLTTGLPTEAVTDSAVILFTWLLFQHRAVAVPTPEQESSSMHTAGDLLAPRSQYCSSAPGALPQAECACTHTHRHARTFVLLYLRGLCIVRPTQRQIRLWSEEAKHPDDSHAPSSKRVLAIRRVHLRTDRQTDRRIAHAHAHSDEMLPELLATFGSSHSSPVYELRLKCVYVTSPWYSSRAQSHAHVLRWQEWR